MADDEKVTLKMWIAVIGTMVGAFMAVLDIQITNSSLRDIAGGISATPTEASWISTSYLIGEIVTIPLTAWLSRVFSVRWYLLVNVVLFLMFSALCGAATSLGAMIAFRAGQGFTGGVFIPMALTVMLTTFPKRLHGIGQAVFGITATLAPAIGPVLGGWLTEHYGWEWNFYINFIPGGLMFAAIWYAVDRKPLNFDLLKNGDWFGIAFMAIGLGALVTMLEEGQREGWFGSSFIITTAVLAAVFVPAFIYLQLSKEAPLVNLRLLRNRNMASASAVGFVLGLALYGSVYLIPLYLSEVHGYNALQIGDVLIWAGLPQLLVFVFLPLVLKKWDVRILVSFGCILFGVSCFMNSAMDTNYAGPQFIGANIVRALGQPFTIVPITILATGMLAKRDAGDGSAIFNIMRNLGGSVGIAILSTLVTRREQFHSARIMEDLTAFDPAVGSYLGDLQSGFIAKGADAATALDQARASLAATVSRDANVMAFNDAFYLVGILLIGAAFFVWICKAPKHDDTSAGGH